MESELVDPRKYSNRIFLQPMYKRISVDYPILVRDEVAKKLANVAEQLPKELSLQIDDGYRHPEIQKVLWDNRWNQFKKQNPHLNNEELYEMTRELVFDPKDGIPPHSTGGAVDVTLLGEKRKEINLSAPFEKYYTEPQLHSNKIDKKVQSLRILLNDLMLKQDFAPNPREYWHYSYGDGAWAKHHNKEVIYDQITLPKKIYFSFTKRVLVRVQRKTWKLFNHLFKVDTSY